MSFSGFRKRCGHSNKGPVKRSVAVLQEAGCRAVHAPDIAMAHSGDANRGLAVVRGWFAEEGLSVLSCAHHRHRGPDAIWAKYYAPRGAVNLGISGDQTQHVLWRLDHGEVDGIKPKVAVVLIGTNNCWGDEFPAAETAHGIQLIVERLRAKLPETEILLMGIFPREDTGDKHKQVNKLVSAMTFDKKVHYLDIGDSFLDGAGKISRGFNPDELHLSSEGYQIWAEAIEPKVAELMGEKN